MQQSKRGIKLKLNWKIGDLVILQWPRAKVVDDGWIDFRVIKTWSHLRKWRNIVRLDFVASHLSSTLTWNTHSPEADFNNFWVQVQINSMSNPVYFILFAWWSPAFYNFDEALITNVPNIQIIQVLFHINDSPGFFPPRLFNYIFFPQNHGTSVTRKVVRK